MNINLSKFLIKLIFSLGLQEEKLDIEKLAFSNL
jgi:hypothetical protein